MIGAPALAGESALRGGAGLVTLVLPEDIQLHVAALCPCATSVPLPTRDDALTDDAIETFKAQIERNDFLAIGPGMDQGEDRQRFIRAGLQAGKPAVVDADGLNNLSEMDDWPSLRTGSLILTPHPGEFSRLTGKGIKEIQSDRVRLAAEYCRQWSCAAEDTGPLVLVLKGRETVVTDGQRAYVNGTGNPGLATGGSGDILTGLTAGLLGQGLEPFEAAQLAVYCHGLAGDLAAAKLGEVSLIAADLLDYLPDAVRAVSESVGD
jgi:NAD(P)H-hydrate epimerase